MANTKKKTKKKTTSSKNTKNNTKKKNTNTKSTKNNSTALKNKNTGANTNKKTTKTSKNTETNKKSTKKSNYNKVQGKVLEDKKKKTEQEKKKKVVKQNKQVARNIKKENEQKEKKFLRKIYLVLLSVVIKVKNFFVNLFKNIKKGFIKFGLLLKKIFISIKDKIKNIGKIKTKKKSKKTKKTKKEKKVKKTKEIVLEPKKNKKIKFNILDKLKRKNKPKKNKKIKDKNVRQRKPLRSLTGRVLPSTFLKADRKIRKTIYIKESLIFMIIITIIDFIGFYKTNYLDMLHIFDNSLWNIVITITLTMLITLVGVYIIDYMVTEITLRIRKKR